MRHFCKWIGQAQKGQCGITDPKLFHSEGVHDPHKYDRCTKHRQEAAEQYKTHQRGRKQRTFNLSPEAVDLMRKSWLHGRSKIADAAFCQWRYGH